jgi:phospholipase/carboxylesterase
MRPLYWPIIIFAACSTPAKAPPHPSDPHVVVVRQSGAPDEPLVVALHGRGGSAKHLADRLFADLPPDWAVDIVAFDAPLANGVDGYQWFVWDPGTSASELAERVAAADGELWTAIQKLAHGRKVVITGFSQGAMMAYELAAHHGADVALAVPYAGFLVRGREPATGTTMPPIVAIHGTDDKVIDIERDRRTTSALRDGGAMQIELVELPGVGHELTPDVIAKIRERLIAATTR